MRILFFGGCHVVGAPVGQELGFVGEATRCLKSRFPGQDVAVQSVPGINMSSGARIVRCCRDYHPDLIVLQLGHYEGLVTLHSRIQDAWSKKRLKRDRVLSSDRLEVYEPTPDLSFHLTFTWWIKNVAHLMADAVLRLAHRPSFNMNEATEVLERSIDRIKAHTHCEVLLLSPFPLAQLVVWRYRRELRDRFEQIAQKKGIHFQDCFAILPEKATMANSAYLFADSIHLSRTGHELVGRMVADAVAALASAKGWGRQSVGRLANAG